MGQDFQARKMPVLHCISTQSGSLEAFWPKVGLKILVQRQISKVAPVLRNSGQISAGMLISEHKN